MRALALLAALWATAAQAEGVAPAEDVAALIAAIEAAGCVVNPDNDQDILRAAGLTEVQGQAVVEVLMDDGRAVLEDNALKLKTGVCE